MDRADIEYKLKKVVYNVNPNEKKVICADGTKIHYDKLCVATGSTVNKPDVKGIKAKNIYFLRTADDMNKIKEKLTPGKKVVVIGSGFIANEVAASLVQ